MMWGDLSSSVLISILRQSTPLFQLWQLMLHAGASVFLSRSCHRLTPQALVVHHCFCTLIFQSTGTLVPLLTGTLVHHLTRRTLASWRGWHRTDRRRLTWTFLQQLPTVRLRQHHNVAFAALCSSDNGFWRQEWRHQSWHRHQPIPARTKSTHWG